MNKKKEYQKPAIKAIKLRHTRLLAGSGQQEHNSARQYTGDFDDGE
jgi:hypothetical protein